MAALEEQLARTPTMDPGQTPMTSGSLPRRSRSGYVPLTSGGGPGVDDKLGTFTGVFIPVGLSIWGVVVFVRLGYMIAQAGILGVLGLWFLGYSITISTSLSLSAIATNGNVRGR